MNIFLSITTLLTLNALMPMTIVVKAQSSDRPAKPQEIRLYADTSAPRPPPFPFPPPPPPPTLA